VAPLGSEFDVDSTSTPALFRNPAEVGFAADGSFVVCSIEQIRP
jgi:hypothetical protein